MKESVLNQTPDNELLEMLSIEKENIARMKMNHEVSPLENPNVIRFKRKEIARIMTEISRRKILEKNG